MNGRKNGNSKNHTTRANPLKLHDADFKLLQLIRAIEFGEIENIKIKEGKVVSYRTAWKTGKLVAGA